MSNKFFVRLLRIISIFFQLTKSIYLAYLIDFLVNLKVYKKLNTYEFKELLACLHKETKSEADHGRA